MTAAIIISIVALIVIISAVRIHKKNKKAKEELARQRQIQYEAERKRKLAEQAELARKRAENEKAAKEKQRILDEKNRIFTNPTYSDYVDVTEVPCGIDLSLPKVTSIIYFIGIKGSLIDSTRGILYAHLKDLWKSFIDLSMLKGVSSEMLKYSFPGNKTISGEPIEIYNKVFSQLSDGNTHMYFIRYDSVNGFMLYDSMGKDGIEMSKRAMSYILYIANGYTAPTESFYKKPLPFKTEPTPLALPKDLSKPAGDQIMFSIVSNTPDYDSDIRFSTKVDSPNYDSGIRFRMSSSSSDYRGSIPSQHLDRVMASAKTAQPTRKSTDERYEEELKRMLTETLENIKKLQLNGISLDLIQDLIGKSTRLSELRVTKNHKIILTDFDNLEIDLNPLQTTVYLLFLNHPEGITFYDLPDHVEELREIYGNITGRTDLEAIDQSIAALVDRFDGSISTQCSRIRKAFISVIPDDIAKNYYIDGKQGKAKSISLARSYVRRDDLGSASVNFATPIAQKGKEYMELVEASNFKSFVDLSFLLRPLQNIDFKKGYVPDAFWSGTSDDRYLKFYACAEGSVKQYPALEGNDFPTYDDTMFLDGIYSRKQSSLIPAITEYIKPMNKEGIWEAYLLSITETVIPHLKSSTAERRRYIMSHRDLIEVLGTKASENYKNNGDIVPSVKMNEDGSAVISCCYASSKQNGLCKEIIRAESNQTSVKFKTESIEILEAF